MKLRLNNIRVRLIVWYILSLGCIHLALGTALYQIVSRKLQHELDQRLETYATCLVEILPKHRSLDLPKVGREITELIGLGPNLFVHVDGANNQLIYEATSLPSLDAAPLRSALHGLQDRLTTLRLPRSGPWRVVKRQVVEGGQLAYVGHVAIPLKDQQQTLMQLRIILALVIPSVMLLASVGAWLLLNRALIPLHEAVQAARSIQARDFSQRLQVPNTGDEVQTLAETFNEMIGRLQRSFEQMHQFISDASHELRTPLTVLKGEFELGLKACPRPDGCDILANCSNEVSRLSRLVETLLFLSNADAEKMPLELKPISLDRLMEEMAEEARILAELKHIQVELVNGSKAVFDGDEVKLRRLLLNLIDNAVKYTPEGGRLMLRSGAENGHVDIQVSDTGIGIEAADLLRIFDRFYRADKSRSRASGSYGLGLSICKCIAEAHGGTIRAESAPGKGSTFCVSLPVA